MFILRLSTITITAISLMISITATYISLGGPSIPLIQNPKLFTLILVGFTIITNIFNWTFFIIEHAAKDQKEK